jgi:hypothetical protein
MGIRPPQPCGKGFRLGFGREILEAIEASRHAVAIDRPEVSVFGIARLDDIDTVGKAGDAAPRSRRSCGSRASTTASRQTPPRRGWKGRSWGTAFRGLVLDLEIVNQTFVSALIVAASARAAVVPIMIAAAVFASAVGHVKANNRFDLEAPGMSAFRASDAFKTIGVGHD